MKSDTIYILMNRYLESEISMSDRQELEAWISESPENALLFKQVKQVWEATGKTRLDLELDVNKAWQKTAPRINTSPLGRTVVLAHPIFRVAAAVLLMVALGAIFYLESRTDLVSYSTGLSERQQITLPDGSQVWLNENSQLKHVKEFHQDRRLTLSGEAFFDVVPDMDRPFVVETANIRTTVVGTSFNVIALPQSSLSEVTVVTGKVGVDVIGSSADPLWLVAGNKVTYQKELGNLLKSENTNPNFLAWKNRKLMFENSSLEDIEEVLEEYFKMEIEIANPNLKNCQLTSVFEDPDIDDVLQVIALTLDVTYRQDGIGFIIEGQGCNQNNQ